MSDGLHVLLVRGEGVHPAVVTAIKVALPNLRWVASYDVEWGSVDVVAFQPGEDPDAARNAAAAVPGAQVELLPARPSAMLAAPGGAPGGPPG